MSASQGQDAVQNPPGAFIAVAPATGYYVGSRRRVSKWRLASTTPKPQPWPPSAKPSTMTCSAELEDPRETGEGGLGGRRRPTQSHTRGWPRITLVSTAPPQIHHRHQGYGFDPIIHTAALVDGYGTGINPPPRDWIVAHAA